MPPFSREPACRVLALPNTRSCRYKIVYAAKDYWQYHQTHPPDWIDGKRTMAWVPDDGAEPQLAPEMPCEHIPLHDTRFFNITRPIQMVGDAVPAGSDGSLPTRLCGAWHLHLPKMTAGSFRSLTLVNQDEFVLMVVSGAWRIEECALQASGVGGIGADIVHIRGFAQVCLRVLHQTICIQPTTGQQRDFLSVGWHAPSVFSPRQCASTPLDAPRRW